MGKVPLGKGGSRPRHVARKPPAFPGFVPYAGMFGVFPHTLSPLDTPKVLTGRLAFVFALQWCQCRVPNLRSAAARAPRRVRHVSYCLICPHGSLPKLPGCPRSSSFPFSIVILLVTAERLDRRTGLVSVLRLLAKTSVRFAQQRFSNVDNRLFFSCSYVMS